MLEDKTFKIKTYDHNDAVIYVTQHEYHWRDGKGIHNKTVIAVVPVNIQDSTDEEFVKLVHRACTSLAHLYQNWPDGEIKIHYVINANQFVNVW